MQRGLRVFKEDVRVVAGMIEVEKAKRERVNAVMPRSKANLGRQSVRGSQS